MSIDYVVRRLLTFLLVIWVGMTLIFFLPKTVPGRDPIMERMTMLLAQGGAHADGIKAMVDAYNREFGLDKPLHVQYLHYLVNMSRLDFNYSLNQFPIKVIDIIRRALPWTIALISVSTLLAFLWAPLLVGFWAGPKHPKHWVTC